MVEFTLVFTDENKKIVNLPRLMTHETGRALIKCLKVPFNAKSGVGEIGNAGEVLDSMMGVVLDRILKPHLSEKEKELLTVDSLMEVVEFYYKQIEDSKKKIV